MSVIIIVDDKTASSATLARGLKLTIEEITNGECSVELMEGAIITEALPILKKAVDRKHAEGFTVAGFLFDLVDETRNIPDAGALLLDEVKSDPDLKSIPVVIYTSKNRGFSMAELMKRGAKTAISRQTVDKTADDLGKQTLDAFEIPYRGSRTGSTGVY